MKLACCQLNPIWGDRKANIDKANQLLESYKKDDIDILVLPEMAFTGYVFHSKEEIEPYLEDTNNGPSVTWAKQKAMELNCYIAVGYPEKYQTKKNDDDDDIKYYNSMCFVNPQGELIKTYRKTFLYETDENWAEEGESFDTMMIPGIGKIGFAICMDINPYQFKSEFSAFEFANYHKNEKTDIILGSMAWLKSEQKDDDSDGENNITSVMKTINYWAIRLSPLLREAVASDRNILFVACNRIGTERGSTFAGGSSVLEFSSSGSIHLLNHLSDNEENILVVDI